MSAPNCAASDRPGFGVVRSSAVEHQLVAVSPDVAKAAAWISACTVCKALMHVRGPPKGQLLWQLRYIADNAAHGPPAMSLSIAGTTARSLSCSVMRSTQAVNPNILEIGGDSVAAKSNGVCVPIQLQPRGCQLLDLHLRPARRHAITRQQVLDWMWLSNVVMRSLTAP